MSACGYVQGGTVRDLKSELRREVQLDAISTVLILAMAVLVGLLIYFLSANDIQLPTVILTEVAPRVLLAAFTIMVVVYLADQRHRLRRAVAKSVAETEATKARLAIANEWLSFSHDAASILGDEGVENGLHRILTGAAEHFEADGAAVIGDKSEWSFVAPGVSADVAARTMMHLALVAAGRSAPLLIESLGTEPGQAIAVPLRVEGELRYVLSVWRRHENFKPDELEALGLLGRMIELAIEREELLAEAQAQLEGTLQVLQYLVADKRPDYSRHAMNVANLAADIGTALGVSAAERKQLRMAGLIHDVGMMSLPQDIAASHQPLTAEEMMIIRQHPRIGKEIAMAANFDDRVQEAVLDHHERLDGSGYAKLKGDQISLQGRILAVCEVFDSMTHREYFGGGSTLKEAIAELENNAGILYDADVVGALCAQVDSKIASASLDWGPELGISAAELIGGA